MTGVNSTDDENNTSIAAQTSHTEASLQALKVCCKSGGFTMVGELDKLVQKPSALKRVARLTAVKCGEVLACS